MSSESSSSDPVAVASAGSPTTAPSPKKSLFIFRRDYRIEDNLGLIHALKETEESVLPVFIFTPEQSDKKKNKYFSDNSFQFLLESLDELSRELPGGLLMVRDDNVDALKAIHKAYPFEALFCNMDYTPYALDRDAEIRKWCEAEGIRFDNSSEDYLLMPMGSFLKADGAPYTKFTPFKNNAYKIGLATTKGETAIPKPAKVPKALLKKLEKKASSIAVPGTEKVKSIADVSKLYVPNPDIIYHGGRKEALKRLGKMGTFKGYANDRNVLSKSTTLLSAYINFGCVSIRECFWEIAAKLGVHHGLNDQLLWREFWYYVAKYFPHVINYKGPNKPMWPEYEEIHWKNPKKVFEAWCEGRTGFPAVDAGMRELNQTGYMHNRARLIVSGILVKNFGIDWRWGEEYFSQKLVDINAPVNSGNWQWSASTGENKGEYYRIMNPWTQSEKFDKNAEYIKKWVPELKDVPAKDIHNWGTTCDEHLAKGVVYIKPVVEYNPEMRKGIMDMYKEAITKYRKQ